MPSWTARDASRSTKKVPFLSSLALMPKACANGSSCLLVNPCLCTKVHTAKDCVSEVISHLLSQGTLFPMTRTSSCHLWRVSSHQHGAQQGNSETAGQCLQQSLFLTKRFSLCFCQCDDGVNHCVSDSEICSHWIMGMAKGPHRSVHCFPCW